MDKPTENVKNTRKNRTIKPIRLSSKNSAGTLNPWAAAERTLKEKVPSSICATTHNKTHTVSRTPDARGVPSRRNGLPPIYFETFLSNGSNRGFQIATAAGNNSDKKNQGIELKIKELPWANCNSKSASRLQAKVLLTRFSSIPLLEPRSL